MKMKLRTGLFRLLPTAAALILELLPVSGVLIFASPEERIGRTYAYFDMTLWGYAHFAPPMTAWLTLALAVLSAVLIFKSSPALLRWDRMLSVLCAVLSLFCFAYGADYITFWGVLISILLILRAVIAFKTC